METSPKMYNVAIPGTTDSLSVLRSFMVEAARRAGLSEVQGAQLELAVCEACANIIEHGYKFAPDKMIQVQFAAEPNRVVVTIQDESPEGYPLNQVRVVTLEEFLQSGRRRGLGVYIIRHCADQVEHSFHPAQGNRLRLVFLRQGGRAGSLDGCGVSAEGCC